MKNERTTYIKNLTLRNYRKFVEIAVDFHPELTVLVAENGGGKTALLDGIAVALQYLVDELRESTSHPGFERSDVRLARAPTGMMVSVVPTSLEARAVVDGCETTWSRELASTEGRTTYKNASELAERAQRLLTELRDFADGKRDEPPALPLIVYYGTGRLWSQHKLTEKKAQAAKNLALQTSVYLDCLSPSSSYGNFVVWFESVIREAQNEQQTGIASPHKPQLLLKAVRRAADAVLQPSGWTNLDWDFLLQEVVATHRDQGRLPVSWLSDGIRNLIALVADLAHRAVRLNPHFAEEACTRSPGVVLIDEVDMHLHPAWQQTVVALLRDAFPRVQFILTTHSHLVVSTVPSACVRVISVDGSVWTPSSEVQGAEAAFALSEVFAVDSSPPVPFATHLSRYRSLIEQGQAGSAEAEDLDQRLRAHFGEHHPAIRGIDGLLRLQRFKAQRKG